MSNSPIVAGETYETDDGETLTVAAAAGLLANDSDPDGDAIFVQSFTAAANGDLSVTTDGSFEYTPDAGFVGTETITYTVSDGTETAQGTLTIDVVESENRPPVANADSYTIRPSQVLSVGAALGLLANDNDPDGDDLEVVGFTQADDGTVAPSFDGSFTYTPDAGFVGVDTFTYTLSDGTDTTQGQVTINVVNTPPTVADESYSVEAGENLTVDAAAGLLENDSDADGDPLEVVGFNQASNGVVLPSADGSFTYTPDAGFTGTDSFVYTVSDGFETSQGVATIVVEPPNAAPEIQPPTAFAAEENQTAVGTVAATDADGDDLAFSIDPGMDGSLFAIDADTGALSFATAPDFENPADDDGDNIFMLDVRVSDGEDDDVETVTVALQDVDEGGAREVIAGTAGGNRLVGSEAPERLEAGGGVYDYLFGGGESDVFAFFDRAGARDVMRVLDYSLAEEDSIDLGGASVAVGVEVRGSSYLLLAGGDRDLIIVDGIADPDTLLFA